MAEQHKHPDTGRFAPNPHEVKYTPTPPPRNVPADTPRTGVPVNPTRPKGK